METRVQPAFKRRKPLKKVAFAVMVALCVLVALVFVFLKNTVVYKNKDTTLLDINAVNSAAVEVDFFAVLNTLRITQGLVGTCPDNRDGCYIFDSRVDVFERFDDGTLRIGPQPLNSEVF